MLLEDKTIEKFGYEISSLSVGSKNRVMVKCDYCNSEYDTQYKNRNNSYKKFPKDCCSKCKFKKREEISLATYGVKNSAQRPEVRQKISDNGWIKTEEFAQKRKDSMIQKYGTDNVMKSDIISSKIRATVKERYGVDNPVHIPGSLEKIVAKTKETKIKNGTINLIDGKTLPEHAKEVGLSRSFFGKLVKEKGFEEAVLHEKHISSLETKITNFLDLHNISYLQNGSVGGKKPDIITGNIIVECDGLRWHSDLFVEDNYHKIKRDIYIEHGYKPLFFRSHEIINKFDIVCSIIKNKLDLCENKIFARKCKVVKLNKPESKSFIESNHLMGPGNTTVAYGLFCDSLVSVLEMKRIQGDNWEISRFCNKNNFSVVGGFTKLLSAFEKDFQPHSIKTFIDLRYGEGSYLTNFGFADFGSNLSFKWTNGSKVYNRMQFPGNSGYENDLSKIWDCGQKKYIKMCKYAVGDI